jgi:hypothetical protein
MATLSLRAIAEQHLGRTGDLSVNADVYGYIYLDSQEGLFGTLTATDVLPESGTVATPTRRSLKRHLETISGTSVDLVVFLVAHEPDFSGEVSLADVQKMQYAIQVARDIYARVDLGIRRIEWARIPVDLARDFAHIGGDLDALNLTLTFNGRPGAIDVFLVQTSDSKAGRGPAVPPGTCNKNSLVDMTGCVLEVAGTAQFTGIIVGHEVGHYLGLFHVSESGNLMCGPSGPFHDRCDPSENMTDLTTDQADRMKQHCMINPGS